MLYIHLTSCISPQPGFYDQPIGPVGDRFFASEPAYPGIPVNALRRMSKSVRMGVGAALGLIGPADQPDGILVGTGNGGMEESVKFLRQIIEYEEGVLAPGHFVQSIPNAIASQIGLSSQNRGYNTTYVHEGLGFEHALIDADMLLREQPGSRWLVGGVDEFSAYNYQIEFADGWYKTSGLAGRPFYDNDSPGSIAGEGAALFFVDDRPSGSVAAVLGVDTLHSRDTAVVGARLRGFLERRLPGGVQPDLLLSGENGDSRALSAYACCESLLGEVTSVARYKHLCGEYPTASAFAVWLACQLEQGRPLPDHMVKRDALNTDHRYILLYNNYKLCQHSFILLERFH